MEKIVSTPFEIATQGLFQWIAKTFDWALGSTEVLAFIFVVCVAILLSALLRGK